MIGVGGGYRIDELETGVYKIHAKTNLVYARGNIEAAREMWQDQAVKVCGDDNFLEKNIDEYEIYRVDAGPFLKVDQWQNVKNGIVVCDIFSDDRIGIYQSEMAVESAAPLNQPQAGPLIDTYVPDITGTWVSDITDNDNSYFRNENLKKLVVTFEQSGKEIVGKISLFTNAYIKGTREGDTIKFIFYSPPMSPYEIIGEWKVSADGYRLEGTWRHPEVAQGSRLIFSHASGKWNLTKIK